MTTDRSNPDQKPEPEQQPELDAYRLSKFTRYSDGCPLPQGWLVRYHPHTDRWTATYGGMVTVFETSRSGAEEKVRVKAQQQMPKVGETPAPEQPRSPGGAKVWALGAAALVALLAAVAGAVVVNSSGRAETPAPEQTVELALPESCQQVLVAAEAMADTATKILEARDATDGTLFSYHLDKMKEWDSAYDTARHACNEALGY